MFGGDEFVIICENHSHESFEDKINRAREEINREYPDAVCMGYTWSDTEIDTEKLINNAEELMMIDKQRYYQKARIINRHYDPEIIRELEASIERGEYTVFLQPKARTGSGEIAGAEALIRKLDKDKGIIYPGAFVPVFERQNMIRHIDLFVFEETFKILDIWNKEGKALIPISLNFSRATVLEKGILNTMEDISSKYDVDKKYVEIEITESLGSMEIETMRRICNGIKEKGYRIALDDFGTKYSSMAMISAMNFDVIKMDKSITNDILDNKTNQILMKNIFSACHEIGIETVSEGVETQEQFDLLSKMGCDYGQGYLFNKAIPWREFEKQYVL
ncbi:MAG: EAL domain-containing protein [Lachnospiraceae bacterium]|nr:EAL domain-containing protein [Lachnospiraceae bacterium]